MTIKNVCVFCSARSEVDNSFLELAKNCGQMLAEKKYSLVYGGGESGLMGQVAEGTYKNGGEVIGIYPKFMEDKVDIEPLSHHLSTTILVDSMSERKDLMLEKSDAFIILPGGFGTLDELYEVMTLKVLEQHNKPIIVCNFNGFWAPMLALNKHIIDNSFAKDNAKGSLIVVSTLEEVFAALK